MFEPGMIKAAAVEITPVIPFERRAVVGIIETVAIVPVPGRVVIINVPGELIFVCYSRGVLGRGGGISILVGRVRRISIIIDRGRLLINDRGLLINGGGGSTYINSGAGDPEADVCINEDLGITGSSDEAGGYDG
jgi:hypothetical protein